MMLTTIPQLITEELGTRPHSFANLAKLIAEAKTNQIYEGAYVGSYSLTLRNKSQTFVAINHSWCQQPASASTIARAAMKPILAALNRKRFYWSRHEKHFLEVPTPLYCTPVQQYSHLVYVDIKGCFFNLYKKFPIDLRYGGRNVAGCDIVFADLLPTDIENYKLVRNSIPGIWRAWSSQRITEGRLKVHNTINNFLSPIHWAVLSQLLHLFAQEAVRLGAVYYNTDGAIFLTDESALAWIDFIAAKGLVATIKAIGNGFVWSIGRYQIDGKRWGGQAQNFRSFYNLQKINPQVLTAWDKWC